MVKRIRVESEAETKSVCHLIIAHGMWVDVAAHLFDFLNQRFGAKPNLYIPRPFLAQLSDEDRVELLLHILNAEYEIPEPCETAAFELQGQAFKPVLNHHHSKTSGSTQLTKI